MSRADERAHSPPVFAIGTGRCGTHFVAKLLAREPAVAAHHERDPLGDSFHRYCVWNGLPVDDAGFLAAKAAGVAADRARGRLSFEASAFLALSVPALHAELGARFILMVRRPDRVVNSFLHKGWYADEPARRDARLALGHQPGLPRAHHPFSRLAAFGDEGERWARLSRVGKLAYFWRRLNELSLRDLERLPREATRIQPLEQLDFDAYGALAEFIGFAPTLSPAAFERIAAEKPGARGPAPSVRDWSASEAAEFEAEVAPLAERLGYAYSVAELRSEPERTERTPSFALRLRGLLGARTS
ncbi:MAG TPA: hypothetical protein VFT98_22375 [Myxococcota bacterium]|nr:hypothetical protein [Myxococcota bacterium]